MKSPSPMIQNRKPRSTDRQKEGLCALQDDVKSRKEITRLGFEPRLTVPKTEVLPLHHRVISLWGSF